MNTGYHHFESLVPVDMLKDATEDHIDAMSEATRVV